jgi:YHS domain-containing protein
VIISFFRLIFYAVVFYLIYKFITYVFVPRGQGRSARSPQKLSGVMVKDEACNTYLPQEDAIRETIDGREYYFCSKECRQKFIDQKKNKN